VGGGTEIDRPTAPVGSEGVQNNRPNVISSEKLWILVSFKNNIPELCLEYLIGKINELTSIRKSFRVKKNSWTAVTFSSVLIYAGCLRNLINVFRSEHVIHQDILFTSYSESYGSFEVDNRLFCRLWEASLLALVLKLKLDHLWMHSKPRPRPKDDIWTCYDVCFMYGERAAVGRT